MNNKLLGMIMGLAVGDALGMPAQFYPRSKFIDNPITKMEPSEDGPSGTYSDDTAMTLCTLASFVENSWECKTEDVMSKFIAWLNDGYMTPDGFAIDVGIATRKAIQRAYDGIPVAECGCKSEWECGNGSLMRISPLIFYVQQHKSANVFELVSALSSLTHAHERCILSCYVYVSFGNALLNNPLEDKLSIFKRLMPEIFSECDRLFSKPEVLLLERLRDIDKFVSISEAAIKSSGYVIDTLEASLWCFLTTDSYKECIIKAVNLGDDADTVAAIAGALAGLYYGYAAIPQEWIEALRGKEHIYNLCVQVF